MLMGGVNLGRWSFARAVFESDASFAKCRFHHEADFTSAMFNGLAVFAGADFMSNGLFVSAQFERGADFSDASFGGFAEFSRSKWIPSEVDEGVHASFNCATFAERVAFVETNFGSGPPTFEKTTFEDAVSLRGRHRTGGRSVRLDSAPRSNSAGLQD
jgi:hypothetical protein